MRWLVALLLLGYGIAHLPGFLVGWELTSFPELPFRTTVLANTVDVGLLGARVVGTAWMIVSFMFIALAATIAIRPAAVPHALPVALVLSATLCVLGWPDARIGLVMNGLIALGWVVVRFG